MKLYSWLKTFSVVYNKEARWG